MVGASPPTPSPEEPALGAQGDWAEGAGGFAGLWDPGFLFVSPSGSALSREDTAWAALPPLAPQWPSACPLGSPSPADSFTFFLKWCSMEP